MFDFLEGFVTYPDTLPCPQVDTDLVPRERRYISDITDVRNMRMFQQEFQATRNRISFVFTEEEAREFREWYENGIIHGGAWFYADWPTLHKDKKIAHRFVGQPKWEWLFGANPGYMGRSSAGWGGTKAPDAVTMYKVTATVELYEPRKVGKTLNVYTSKIYPIFAEDALQFDIAKIRGFPFINADDAVGFGLATVVGAASEGYYYTERNFGDNINHGLAYVTSVEKFGGRKEANVLEHLSFGLATVTAAMSRDKITYDYLQDALSFSLATVVAGETS